MILKNVTFKNLAKIIELGKKKVIVFGAGMIGTITVPHILEQYIKIENKIECYIDNDKTKWGTDIPSGDKKIFSPDFLHSINADEYILLITISRFSDVLEQLKAFSNLENMECYIAPMMCIKEFKTGAVDGTIKTTDIPIIPKVIHYMWLGHNPIPESLQFCIDSWKKFCPDYEIICWNEDNYDIEKNSYMRQAYEHKAFGFVPDYARLDILYQYGGIYLDTDVELKKSLDDMLYQEAFCGVEKWQTINFGGGSGSVKGNLAIKKLLDARENVEFVNQDGSLNKNTCGYYDTATLIKYGYTLSGTIQSVLGLNIYPYEYFHPYDYMSGRVELTEHTYGIHHFNGGWLDPKMKQANMKTAENFERLYAVAENCI